MTDLDDLEQRVRATDRAIRRYCRRNDIPIGIDGAVSEDVAAKMLGYAGAPSLRKAIKEGTIDLPYRLLGNARKYRSVDLAMLVERSYTGGGNLGNRGIDESL